MPDFCLKTAMERDGGRCRTRDGRPVRIICENIVARNQKHVMAIAIMEDGAELVYCCDKDGQAFNLVNLPQSHEVTVQLHRFKKDVGEASNLMLSIDLEGTGIGQVILKGYVSEDWEKAGKSETVRIEED